MYFFVAGMHMEQPSEVLKITAFAGSSERSQLVKRGSRLAQK